MRRLTDEEYRALLPVGQLGEFASGAVLARLIRAGLAVWVPDLEDPGCAPYLAPTELGALALRVEELVRAEERLHGSRA